MMQISIRRLWRLCVLGGAAICAVFAMLAPAGAQSLPFKPPQGWTPVAAPAGIIGKWVKPGNEAFQQSMNVFGRVYGGTLAEYYDIDVLALKKRFPGGDIAVAQDTTVCGGSPAKYVSYALGTSAGPLIVEQIVAVENGVAYVVTYVRLAGQMSDPAARRSMTTICGI